MPTKYATVAGVAAHYTYTGATTLPPLPPTYDRGEVFLFLHGVGGNAGLWQRQLRQLSEHHSAVAVDFPGHGRSGSTEGLGSIGAYADFVAGFMEAVKLPPAVVVGACMGGAVGLELAARHPARAKALALINATAEPRFAADAVATWESVTHGRAPQPFTTEAFSSKTDFAVMRELWMEQVKTDPRVRWQDMVACNAYDGRNRLKGLALPVLILTGSDDALVPPSAAEALGGAVAGARVLVVDDAGHFAAVERSEQVAEALAQLAAGVASKGAR
jgi:pimeloyl-ACP methyl ester carboxylesterase